jgi:uncharacterized protein (TIGR02246 family)
MENVPMGPTAGEFGNQLFDAAARFSDRWVEAFNRADIEALVRLYTRDILFFGSLPDLFVGHDGVRAYFSRVLLNRVQTQMEQRQFRSVTSGVLAMSGFLNSTWDAGDQRQYRITWTLVETDGEWLIALHHGSLRPN